MTTQSNSDPAKTCLAVLAAFPLLLIPYYARESYTVEFGNSYLELVSNGNAHTEARKVALSTGTAAAFLTVAMPLLLSCLMPLWCPRSRFGHALKFSAWPAVFLLFVVAGPMARLLNGGVVGSPRQSLGDALQGWVVLSAVAAAIAMPFGYWLNAWRARSSERAAPSRPAGGVQPQSDAPPGAGDTTGSGWRQSSREFRAWIFASAAWPAGVLLLVAVFHPFGEGSWKNGQREYWTSEPGIQTLFVMAVPLLAAGLRFLYLKFVR